MKKYTYTALVTLCLFIFSCSVVDKLLTFTISKDATITIPKDLPAGIPISGANEDIVTNSSVEFENNNTNANLVKDVRLKELVVTITNPTDKTFSFLKSIYIYISTDGSDEIQLAHQDNINSTTNTLTLIPTDAKLDKYVKASSFKLRTSATLKEATTEDITVKGDVKFNVTANPF